MKNKIRSFIFFVVFTILSLLPAQSENYQAQISSNTISYSSKEIEELFKQKLGFSIPIIFTEVPRGLVISMDSSYFFESSKDEILEKSMPILDNISEVLKDIKTECIIEVSTKTEDVHQIELWELSLMRADKICDYLIKCNQIPPSKIRAIGFGDLQPFNSSTNQNIDNRIDFLIINYETTR